MRQLESQEQKKIVQWWALACKRYKLPEKLLFAIPNGGRRDVVTGARLKAEGVRTGVPDMFLAFASNGFHGLFLELKAKGGRLSKEQKTFLEMANIAGYATAVPIGFIEAKDVIEKYLNTAK